jgi:hypothetical protein
VPESSDDITPAEAVGNIRFFPRPEPARSADDQQLAGAYRELEATIGDLRSMAYILPTLMDGVYRCEHPTESRYGARMFLLNEEHADSLAYASSQLSDVIRDLHRGYFATLDGSVPRD